MNAPLTKAGGLVRVAKTLARSQSMTEVLNIAETERASEQVMAALRRKASTAGGSLDNWAGEITDDGGAAKAFIESIRSASLFYGFTERANVFPLREKILATAALQVGGEIGEGEWLPVVAGSFTQKELAPRKTGGIIVVSDTLVRSTDPASFAVLRRELQRAAIAAVDDTFLSVLAADLTPETATEDPLGDLRAMLATVNTTGGGQLAFMVAPDAANTASTVTDTAGARMFPNMTPTGGAMLGVPAMVSDRITAGRIILADGTGFMVNEGAVDVDRADGGALKMQTDPGSGAAELVALWQNNMNALRVIAVFGAERARDDAAAILDSAAAAWVGETI